MLPLEKMKNRTKQYHNLSLFVNVSAVYSIFQWREKLMHVWYRQNCSRIP